MLMIRKSYRHGYWPCTIAFKLAELIQTRLNTGKMVVDIWKDTNQIVEDLPNEHSFKTGGQYHVRSAQFRSYWVVLFLMCVAERSREPEVILVCIERDVADGGRKSCS